MARLTILPVLALLAGCAAPGPKPTAAAAEVYVARGQEPGWTVTIANQSIAYVGNYGDKKITVPRPDPRTTFNGHLYETARLVVDITHRRCNDAMSGHGYADRVTVTADGETYGGCGGDRRADWDD